MECGSAGNQVNDNFFDLGGQSLLAAQIISRTRTAFQIEIALCSLFYKPTIAAFAIAVEGAESTGTQHGKEYLDGALRMLGAT